MLPAVTGNPSAADPRVWSGWPGPAAAL